jgi:hypothetical protein
MRVSFAAAILVFGIAASAPVAAADLIIAPGATIGNVSHGQMSYGGGFYGERLGSVIVYDYEPGVITRAWFLPPWRSQHYIPATGHKPRVGRAENLSIRHPVKPAQSFYRVWSTTALVFPDAALDRAPLHAHARALDDEGVPQHSLAAPGNP